MDFLLLAIEPESVLCEGRVGAGGGGRTEVVLVEGDGEGGVCGQDEFCIALAPVSVHKTVSRKGKREGRMRRT